MAIKARETITIIKERDVNATWRFYRIASSTSTPSQPTEAQGKAYVNNQTVPSGWSISEPAYDGTSTNSLYTCDLTSFTDGEVSWSVVSKSSSYEAAKQAYNEAQNAKKVATNFMSADSTGIMVADMRSGSSQTPSNPSGRNVLIDNDSVDIRNGRDVLASFGSTAVIGKDNNSQALIDYHSLQMIDAGGNPYFVAADMRDESGNALIRQEFEATYRMYDNDDDVDVMIAPAIEIVDILNENGVSVYNGEAHAEITDDGTIISVETQNNHDGEIWTLIYRSTGEAKYYTLGQRSPSVNRGAFSVTAGFNAEASGYASFAEGFGTKSGGKGSHAEGIGSEVRSGILAGHAEGVNTFVDGRAGHAEGVNTCATNGHASGNGTIAYHAGQVALGWYNIKLVKWRSTYTLNPEYVVVIGNGTSDSERSNAMIVTWDGAAIGQAMAGMIQMFAGSNPPAGWLICNGAAVSRTTYARLFAVIGTTYGAGDGSTTFNLPDMRGRMPVGVGKGTASDATTHSLNEKNGTETVKLTAAQSGNQAQTITSGGMSANASHSHASPSGKYYLCAPDTQSADAGAALSGSGYYFPRSAVSGWSHPTSTPSASVAHTHSVSVAAKDASSAHSNMPPYIGVNYIICTGKTDLVGL